MQHEAVIYVGSSHTLSPMAAARAGDLRVDFINLKHMPTFAENSEVQELHPAIVARLAGKTVVSMVGGNAHNELGLVRHPRPFDFVLPTEPELPADDGELIPAEALEAVLRKRMAVGLSTLTLIKQHARGKMYHCESPAPGANDDYIRASIDPYFEKRGVAELGIVSPRLRYKLWRLHSEIMRGACAELQIEFIPCPAEALEGGFLRAELCANATHANERYGAMVLSQIGAL